ncbi:MAG: hypothetical protein KJ018_04600, partial [Burkholderiales bacterium]|nr:hypothetical protein [Burkholderiales bacterium]
ARRAAAAPRRGLGDIAAVTPTLTAERREAADFVAAEDPSAVKELPVTGPASPRMADVDGLAGRTVHVRGTVRIVLAPDALEDEDMVDMVAAGLLQAIVVDDWKARIWSRAQPKIAVREDVVLRGDARMGWAIRNGSPRLAAEIEAFYPTSRASRT